MMGQAFPNTISRTAAVVAPGLMVMGIILFMGKVSGAHLNPAVSIAFSLRGDFPWRRVPGYVVVQLIGASLAALFLHAVINVSATYGSNYPASGYSSWQAFLMEAVLTLGLVSVILGTASGAQNIGIFGAIGVGGYIALAGLWGSPISGASMNPARTFGPDLVSARLRRATGSTSPARSSAPRSPSASRTSSAAPAAARPDPAPRRATSRPRSRGGAKPRATEFSHLADVSRPGARTGARRGRLRVVRLEQAHSSRERRKSRKPLSVQADRRFKSSPLRSTSRSRSRSAPSARRRGAPHTLASQAINAQRGADMRRLLFVVAIAIGLTALSRLRPLRPGWVAGITSETAARLRSRR